MSPQLRTGECQKRVTNDNFKVRKGVPLNPSADSAETPSDLIS